MPNLHSLENALPVAPLKLVVMDSAQAMGEEINSYLVEFRKSINNKFSRETGIQGYVEDSYLAKAECPRFGTGEGKGVFKESIRGKDLFILVDVCNHSLTYTVNGYTNHKSPDDHYQDLKRIIAAATGKAHRINVIMPFLYEGRQHKRSTHYIRDIPEPKISEDEAEVLRSMLAKAGAGGMHSDIDEDAAREYNLELYKIVLESGLNDDSNN